MCLKKLFLPIALLSLLASCGGKHSDRDYTISGTLPASVDAEWVYLYSTESDMPTAIDSARVEKGSFLFKGVAPDTLRFLVVHPGGIDQYPAVAWSLFLEPGDIKIDTLSEFVTGTPINDGIAVWMDSITTIMMEEGSPEALRNFLSNHWAEHSADFVGAFTLSQLSPYLDFPFVDSLAAQIPTEARTSSMVAPFFQQLETMRQTQPGHPFVDVSLVDVDGNPSALADIIGKGNYVLVDFWASWCGPCRQAMPLLQSTVAKYGQLKVYGIAVSDKIDDTRKAIADLQIKWTVLSDPDALSARTYGVSTIPAMILFAPDGTIMARDFTVNELDELLSQHLE